MYWHCFMYNIQKKREVTGVLKLQFMGTGLLIVPSMLKTLLVDSTKPGLNRPLGKQLPKRLY